MISILSVISALALAAVAAYFSIVGLTAIFPGSFVSIVIMASVMECVKLVAAAQLHLNWHALARGIRAYLVGAVVVLMLITSMGIFGYLSKSHIEQTSPVGNASLKIERLDQQISREQSRIDDAERVIDQLDGALDKLLEYDKVSGPDGYRAVRNNQQEQRDLLTATIDASQAKIDVYQDEKLELNQQLQAIQLEVGPLKYVAALLYDNPEDRIEETVRILILLLVFVFDPLAVILLLSGLSGLKQPREITTEEVFVIDPVPRENAKPNKRIEDLKKTKPKFPKNTKASTRGWVDVNNELIRAMKMTEEEVELLNR